MDKIEAANQLNTFLGGVVKHAGFKLKYRITVDPADRRGPRLGTSGNSGGIRRPRFRPLLERGGELLRSLELLAMEMLRLPGNEHEKINFDCMGHRKARLEELRLVRARSRRESPPERHTLRVRAHVLARTPHSCTWHCATNRTSAPRAPAKACGARSCFIPRTTSPPRSRSSAAGVRAATVLSAPTNTTSPTAPRSPKSTSPAENKTSCFSRDKECPQAACRAEGWSYPAAATRLRRRQSTRR